MTEYLLLSRKSLFSKQKREKRRKWSKNTTNRKAASYAALGIGMASKFGNVTERRSSKEKTSPKKCDSIVLADAWNIRSKDMR